MNPQARGACVHAHTYEVCLAEATTPKGEELCETMPQRRFCIETPPHLPETV